MPSLKSLLEQRGEALSEIQRLRDVIATESRDFTADETQSWERANDAYDAHTKQIDILQRAKKLEGLHQEIEAPAEARSEEKLSVRESLLRNKYTDIELRARAPKSLKEVRAMSTGTDSEGGYIVEDTLANQVEIALLAHGGIREYSTIIRTSNGSKISLPTVDDTSNSGNLEGENDALATTDVVFGSTDLDAFKVSSDMVKVPYELATDANYDLQGLLGGILAERVARKASALYCTGTGSAQPAGYVTGSTLGKAAAGAAAITTDELIDLYHSVDPAYRVSPNAAWAMNDSTVKLIRKLQDGDSQYIWQPGLAADVPAQLFGRPVVIDNNMPAATTGLKSVIFGDFSKFFIRDAGLRVVRMDERFADNDQIAWVILMRLDSVVLNAGTNPIKHLIQA